MLLPKLLEPADHATAANLLIAHLAEATRLGAAAEALIRLPVLATLGLLTVDAGTAKKLLTAVLNVSSLTQMLFTSSRFGRWWHCQRHQQLMTMHHCFPDIPEPVLAVARPLNSSLCCNLSFAMHQLCAPFLQTRFYALIADSGLCEVT